MRRSALIACALSTTVFRSQSLVASHHSSPLTHHESHVRAGRAWMAGETLSNTADDPFYTLHLRIRVASFASDRAEPTRRSRVNCHTTIPHHTMPCARTLLLPVLVPPVHRLRLLLSRRHLRHRQAATDRIRAERTTPPMTHPNCRIRGQVKNSAVNELRRRRMRMSMMMSHSSINNAVRTLDHTVDR
jgi:hypothetical protein